jgi:hypothetical protein
VHFSSGKGRRKHRHPYEETFIILFPHRYNHLTTLPSQMR